MDEPEVRTRELYETAARFVAKLERLTDRHGIVRQEFTVRARRCDDVSARAADVYRVGIGLRGLSSRGRAGDLVADIHKGWTDAGWRITDYRRLDDGGLAIGGTDPDTGEEHSWDTGFAVGPGRQLVGGFATPCYREPGGAVGYGDIPLSRLEPFAAGRLRGPNPD